MSNRWKELPRLISASIASSSGVQIQLKSNRAKINSFATSVNYTINDVAEMAAFQGER
jgi:hypothetical protein